MGKPPHRHYSACMFEINLCSVCQLHLSGMSCGVSGDRQQDQFEPSGSRNVNIHSRDSQNKPSTDPVFSFNLIHNKIERRSYFVQHRQ